MLDIGFLELMLVGIVGLLVLGPERLPRAARTAGMWIGKIKRTVSGMQREISAQLEAEELRQKLNEQQQKLDNSLKKAKLDVESIADTPASARLDDALQAVREDAPPPTAAPSQPADPERTETGSANAEPGNAKAAALNKTEADKADVNKDSNHQ